MRAALHIGPEIPAGDCDSIGCGSAKGTAVDWVRGSIDKMGPDGDAAMARALSSEDYETYRSMMAVGWIREDVAGRILRAAGNILFAGATDVTFEMGRILSKAHITGIYRMLLKVATIPLIIAQASRLWRTLHDRGEPSSLSESNGRCVTFVVRDYPEFPTDMRNLVRGYIVGLGELAGEKVTTRLDESDPNAWKWISTW